MRRTACVFLLVALICTSGCILAETDTVYNHSGQDLTIIAIDFDGKREEMLVGAGAHIQFYSPYIEVRHKDGVWHYNLKEMVNGYFNSKKTRNVFFVNLQIEPNGSVYVIPPKATGIVTRFPRQPEGFPLRPQQ